MRREEYIYIKLVLILFLLININMFADEPVKVWEESIELPTYKMGAADKNPMFYKDESYQSAKRKIYPYALQESVTNIKENQPHRFLFLENEYVKLSVAPDIGGRLFSALDKTNGYDFFYKQNVIKPALIGMLGPWISGGLEWNIFHHHRNTTHMPVNYTMSNNGDGSATIWLSEIERRHRMQWIVGITLHPGSSAIEVSVKMFNRTHFPNTMLYWANLAVRVNDEYQVIFPPSVNVTTYHAKNEFISWPIGNGQFRGVDYTDVDLSWWKNHPNPNSFFAWDLSEDFMGGYDHKNKAGVAHSANHHILPGAKLWEWGPGKEGKMWDTEILTDSDDPYAELMVGAYSNNQPDYSWIKPGQVRTFKQYWFPVRDIKGFKKANKNAAANMIVEDKRVFIGLNTTTNFRNSTVILSHKGMQIYKKKIDINPSKPFANEIALDSAYQEKNLSLTLLSESGREIINYNPIHHEDVENLPETVKKPPLPTEIDNQEETYLTGLRLQQINNPTVDPNLYYMEVLKNDSLDIRTNTTIGINYLRHGLYRDAEKHFNRSLSRKTIDYTRPGNTEENYYLGIAQQAQGKIKEAVDNFYRASWDYTYYSVAFEKLAEIESSRKNYDNALSHINNALSTNANNSRLKNIKISILRKLGQSKVAIELTEKLILDEPLNYWAINELHILNQEAGNKVSKNQNDIYHKLLRNDVENYLEIATEYNSLGMWQEAFDYLKSAIDGKIEKVSTYPILNYYLGYFSKKLGDIENTLKYYKLANSLSPDYCFPFRFETEEVLIDAISENPSDKNAYYYLGNLLYDHQPERAIKYWEKAHQIDSKFALNNRNLGWGYYRYEKNMKKAITLYEEAVSNNHTDPRLLFELDELYEYSNTSVEKRFKMFDLHKKVAEKMNGTYMRFLNVLILHNNYDQPIEFMDEKFFPIPEGGESIHQTFVDAHLLRGLKKLKKNNYKGAVEDFVRATEFPTNHSVGVPNHDEREAQIKYLLGLTYGKMGEIEKAQEYFEYISNLKVSHTEEEFVFRAIAKRKLGLLEDSNSELNNLIKISEERLNIKQEIDFFAKFGEQESEEMQIARAHYIIGLAKYGLNDKSGASESFKKSREMNLSHTGTLIAQSIIEVF